MIIKYLACASIFGALCSNLQLFAVSRIKPNNYFSIEKLATQERDSLQAKPMYNLFYLSKVLAEGEDNEIALGYLNTLFSKQKNKDVKDEMDYLQSFVQYESLKNTYKKNIENYFIDRINNTITANIEINNLQKKYQVLNIFTIEPEKEIELYNDRLYLSKLREVNLIGNINNFIIEYNNKESVGTKPELIDKIDDIVAVYSIIGDSNSKVNDLAMLNCYMQKSLHELKKVVVDNKKDFKVVDIILYNYDAKDAQLFVDSYKSYYEKLRTEINQKEFALIINFLNRQKSLNDYSYFKEVRFDNSKNIQVQAVLQQEQQLASGFKLPSESDVIMALAKFMSNRAKQEAMIWFVQNLQEEMQSVLLADIFPASKILLEEYNGVSVPNLNDAFRYALASDFVNMPSHMIKGKWLQDKALMSSKSEQLESLKKVAVLSEYFYRLVREKNNYRSVLENLYLEVDSDGFLSEKSNLKDAITLLHIISNEFYTVNNNSVSFLSIDQIRGMDIKQWQAFLTLVKLKYGDDAYYLLLSKMKSLNLDQKTKFKEEIDLVTKFDSKKLASLVNGFAQLQTISKSAAADSGVSFSSVWDKMIELLKHVDPNYDAITNTFDVKNYQEIAQLENLHTIYRHINNKEFNQASKATIELIKPFVNITDIKIDISNTAVEIYSSSNLSDKNKKRFSIKEKYKKSLNTYETLRFSKKSDDGTQIMLSKGANDHGYYSIEELRNGFKEVNYSYLNDKLDVAKINTILCKNSSMSKFINAIYKHNIEGSDRKFNITEDQLKFANLIVDIYDEPNKLISKKIYSSLKIQDVISNSMFQNAYLNNFISTSALFSDILASKDEQGLYKVIEGVMAPPESYLIKRHSPLTITFNGYVGGFVGYQWVDSRPSDYTNSFIYGITAPIGLTISNQKWGVFFQGIELGNAVNHYLWNTVDRIDKNKLSVKELFSPGMNLMWNIPDSPFVAYIGGKVVQLEKRYDVDLGYVNTKGLDLYQLTMGVKFDIPFFTIKK